MFVGTATIFPLRRMSGIIIPGRKARSKRALVRRTKKTARRDEKLDRFAKLLIGRGYRPKTVDNYQRQISYYLEKFPKPEAVSDEDVLLYFAGLRTDGRIGIPWTEGTVKCAFNAIRAFYKTFKLADPTKDMDCPKVTPRIPLFLSMAQVAELINSPDLSTWLGHRNRAILATFCCTGIRLGELEALNLSDVDFESRQLHVRDSKTGQPRKPYINDTLLKILTEYLVVRPQGCDESLFPSKDGRRLIASSIRQFVTYRYGKQIGEKRRLYPHKLRHTCLTQIQRSNRNIRHTQEIAGHKSIASTMIYTHNDPKDLIGAYSAVEIEVGK